MTDILEYIDRLEGFRQMSDAVRLGKTCAVFGVDTQKIYFAARLIKTSGKKAFIVVPDEKRSRAVYEFLDGYCGGAYTFPAKDYTFRDIESSSKFDEDRRIDALSHIRKRDFNAVIITAASLTALVRGPEEYKETVLYRADSASFADTIKNIEQLGYQRFAEVSGTGQYSVRGGIVDVFPPGEKNPYRIEFFGDDIDSISIFDAETQRRVEAVDCVRITPATEYSAEVSAKLRRFLEQHRDNPSAEKELQLLDSGILPRHDRYLPLYYADPHCILDYVEANDVLIFFDYEECRESVDGAEFRLHSDMQSAAEDGELFVEGQYAFSMPQIIEKCKSPIIFETFARSLSDFKIGQIADIQFYPAPVNSMPVLQDDCKRYLEDGYRIFVLARNEAHAESLKKELPSHPRLCVEIGALPDGFVAPELKIAVFSYGKRAEASRPKRFKNARGQRIKNFSDINIGDYVVHESYGVGIYDGIHKVESQGVINDYIKLKFAGTDVLYFPCSQLDRISKYIGSGSDIRVKLNKLGGGEWEKTKQRVKKAVKEMAKELAELYKERLNIRGHAFSADTEWQKDFEAAFEYEETEDQLKSIAEIKKDMESPVPMDRLLCGDVGFGKTEVAMRAIFKCVMDGKQAAVLAPTTILAMQHYNTMTARFGGYPIKVELLSRYRTGTQQTKILKDLKSGRIDVIIGTHRILQKDVQFRDLGLIIIDEEQRFGVAHKEHLKEISKSADVLTLSATPIPRTLNMAMSGIRDISALNDPPGNRYPVTTYVAEFDMGLIADAIRREVGRGGQCFYLHNRVDTIYKTASMIYEKTGYRVQAAHGKMSQEELSKIWESLVQGQIDVLVCTTIIETGVDVPNCNTLIIEDADRLGLAQLHQIRGRVGRSDRRAFAYFTYRRGKALSAEAYKRLMTIREFTEFGSGLRIAMRDLEIRGAGNILGAEQSGHLNTVGFDLYMKLLGEAVSEEKGVQTHESECTVDLRINAYIPDSYIADATARVEAYKAISTISDDADMYDVTDELIDRFGTPPQEVQALINTARLRAMASSLGICKISASDTGILFYFKDMPDWDTISKITAKYPRRLFFSPGTQPYFTLNDSGELAQIKRFLENLSKCMDKKTQN